MDKIGVDMQVIYPTLFPGLFDRRREIGDRLCSAYNRFITEACGKVAHGLEWVTITHLARLGIAAPLRFNPMGKRSSRGGNFFRGMEGDLTLDNPYFSPIYAFARELDLTISTYPYQSGSRYLMQPFDVERNHTFAHNRVLPVVAFARSGRHRMPGAVFPSCVSASSRRLRAGCRTSFMCCAAPVAPGLEKYQPAGSIPRGRLPLFRSPARPTKNCRIC